MEEICVYILRCVDGSYYVGNTRKPMQQRLDEHNSGIVEGYTRSRLPVSVVHMEFTASLMAAFARERQLKGWSRAKKQALIEGRAEDLAGLASRKGRGD